jgi:hypothetical protein
MNIDALTEDQAISLLIALERKFGWATIVYTRADASNWITQAEDGLTDEEWESISNSWEWRKFHQWAAEGNDLLFGLLDSPEAAAIMEAREVTL